MADKKITQLTELAQIDAVDTDELAVVDVSADQTKKITLASIKGFVKDLFTASDVTDFDTEVSNNTNVTANTTARHTHSNKALLDTYTQTEADLADAVSKKHEHSNKAVLDATTASYTTAEETKLSGIETAATADQTGSEIKAAYEAEADTNAFTDAEKTKLSGIEANADVTDATNVNAAGAIMESDFSSAKTIMVQQSGTGSPETLSVGQNTIVGRMSGGSSTIQALGVADAQSLLNIEDGATADQTGAEIKAAYEAEANTNAFTDAEKTKLSGIEANADVTDATNVAAAGAVIPTGTPDGTKYLRDDGVWSSIPGGGDLLASNNLSDVDNASTARTNLGLEIGSDVQAHSSVLDNTTASFTTADETKLDGIEANATADQTDVEIKTAVDNQLAGSVVGTTDAQTLTNKIIDFDSNTVQNEPVLFALSCSDLTTDLATGTAVAYFRAPYAFTLTGVRASVITAPTGATVTVDINENGTSVLSTKLSIDASEKTSETAATAAVISDSSIANDSEITIDIDQVGSTVAGAGLIVYLIGKK